MTSIGGDMILCGSTALYSTTAAENAVGRDHVEEGPELERVAIIWGELRRTRAAGQGQCLLGGQPHLAGSKLGRRAVGALETSHGSLTGYTFSSRAFGSESGPPVGGETVKEHRRCLYPATKGRAGGKLPAGKGALRSPRLRRFDASRKGPTKAARSRRTPFSRPWWRHD